MPKNSPTMPAEGDVACDECGCEVVEDWFYETETISTRMGEREVIVAWVGECADCGAEVIVR